MVWQSMVWYCMVQYSMVWHGKVWYGGWNQRTFRFPHPIVPPLLTREMAFQFPAQTIHQLFLPLKVFSARAGWNVLEISKFVNGIFYVGLALPSAASSYFQ